MFIFQGTKLCNAVLNFDKKDAAGNLITSQIGLGAVLSSLDPKIFSTSNQKAFVDSFSVALANDLGFKNFMQNEGITFQRWELEAIADQTWRFLAAASGGEKIDMGACLGPLCFAISQKVGVDVSKMTEAEMNSTFYDGAYNDLRQVSINMLEKSLSLLASYARKDASFDHATFAGAAAQLTTTLRELEQERVKLDKRGREETARQIRKNKGEGFVS